MRRPWAVVIPIVLGLLALSIPLRHIEFGGISEKYLAADNPARVAQEDFDRLFPGFLGESRDRVGQPPGLLSREGAVMVTVTRMRAPARTRQHPSTSHTTSAGSSTGS